MRRLFALLLTLTSIALVVGCGGDDEGPPPDRSDSDYAYDVSGAARSFLFELFIVTDSLGDEAAVGDSVEAAVAEIDPFLNELDKQKVPEIVAEPHAALVATLEAFDTDLTALNDRIDSGDTAAADELEGVLAAFEVKLGDLYEEFAAAGYRMPGLLARSQKDRRLPKPTG